MLNGSGQRILPFFEKSIGQEKNKGKEKNGKEDGERGMKIPSFWKREVGSDLTTFD